MRLWNGICEVSIIDSFVAFVLDVVANPDSHERVDA